MSASTLNDNWDFSEFIALLYNLQIKYVRFFILSTPQPVPVS